MSYWEGVRYLTGTYLKQAKWRNVFSIVFVCYILIFVFNEYRQVMYGELDWFNKVFLDYIFFIIMTSVGLFGTHINSFGTKKDLLGERLSYFRSLPIKIDQIIWSRLLNVIINIFALVLLFYVLMYIVLRFNGYQVEWLPFIIHMFGILTIIIMGNIGFLYCELIFSLKIYTLICWIMPFVIAGIMFLYVRLLGKNIIQFIYETAVSHPIPLLLISFLVYALTIAISFRALNKKLRQRSIL